MTVNIRVDISELDKAIGTMDILGANLDGVREKIVDEVVMPTIFQAARDTCPSPTSLYYPTNSSGFLRDSHVSEMLGPAMARVYPTALYGIFVHEGHGSVEARPWLRLAVEISADEINTQVQNRLQEVVHDSFGV